MSTLLKELTNYIQTELNANTKGVPIDIGYLFERDASGFTRVVDPVDGSYITTKQKFIPGMFGQFTGDANKPLNYPTTKQLSKGGSVTLLFSLPDKDDDKELYDNVLEILEDFENKHTGLKNPDGTLVEIVVGTGATQKTYGMSFNTFPGRDNGLIKYDGGWRTLFAMTLAIKAGIGITYGEVVKHEMKRFGADDNTYAVIEMPSPKSGIATAMEYSQPDTDTEAFVGGNSTTYNKSFLVYYPAPIKVAEGEDPILVPGRDLIIELFKRSEDKTFKPDSRYTVRTTYPDFFFVRDFKFVAGNPTTVRGVEVSISVTFAPYKEVTQ